MHLRLASYCTLSYSLSQDQSINLTDNLPGPSISIGCAISEKAWPAPISFTRTHN